MFDFPDTPTVGQTTHGPTGQSYVWDGIKWAPSTAQGEGGGGASISISDTPPILTHGAMWWDSADLRLYIGYNDSDSTQWVVTNNYQSGLASIPIGIDKGGTNATTAAQALTNLGALPIAGGTLTGPLTVPTGLAVNGGTNPLSVSITTNAGTNCAINLQVSGQRAWQIGELSDGTFYVWDNTAGAQRLTINTAGLVTVPSSLTVTNNLSCSALKLDSTNAGQDVALWNGGSTINFGHATDAGVPDVWWGSWDVNGVIVNNARTNTVDNVVMSLNAPGDSDSWLRLTSKRDWRVGTKGAGGYNGVFAISDLTAGAIRLQITETGACSAWSTWGVISDVRLKEDVQPYQRGLADILPLEPIMFRWNGKGGVPKDAQLHYGLSAQQVGEHLPELVREQDYFPPEDARGEEALTLQTYSPTDLTFAMLNAIKELANRVEQLERGSK